MITASRSPEKTFSPDVGYVRYVRSFAYQNHINEEGESRQQTHYFHCDQIVIPREMTDKDSKLLWFGEYTAWRCLKKNERIYKDAHQPFRLQNQYFDEEIGLHYNFIRYYESEADRFVNQDPIRLLSGDNLYQFAPNVQDWVDVFGLARRNKNSKILGRNLTGKKKW